MILASGAIVASFGGCSKTSEDKLAPPVPCDTTNISYSTQVVSILTENCYSCHGNGSTGGSGGINLNNIEDYARTGVDYVSIGALIHQARSLDLSLKAIISL